MKLVKSKQCIHLNILLPFLLLFPLHFPLLSFLSSSCLSADPAAPDQKYTQRQLSNTCRNRQMQNSGSQKNRWRQHFHPPSSSLLLVSPIHAKAGVAIDSMATLTLSHTNSMATTGKQFSPVTISAWPH